MIYCKMRPVNTSIPMKPTEETYRQLYENRLNYKFEMQRALCCIGGKEKKELVKEWRELYSEKKVEELIRMAKNKKVMHNIAHWDLDNFKSRSK